MLNELTGVIAGFIQQPLQILNLLIKHQDASGWFSLQQKRSQCWFEADPFLGKFDDCVVSFSLSFLLPFLFGSAGRDMGGMTHIHTTNRDTHPYIHT